MKALAASPTRQPGQEFDGGGDMAVRRPVPSVFDLQRMPAGDRGPHLRTLIRRHQDRMEGAAPGAQAYLRTMIRQLVEVGRLVGIADLAP